MNLLLTDAEAAAAGQGTAGIISLVAMLVVWIHVLFNDSAAEKGAEEKSCFD